MSRITTMVVAFAFCAAGCHAGKVSVADDSGNTTTPQTGTGPTFSLRIAGTDAGDISSATMRIKSVEVRSADALLANKLQTSEADLAAAGQAYLLASFQVPSGVEDVDFLVAFEGGSVGTAKGQFDLDANCQTLRLSGKVSKIAQHRHAVIALDVARSFVTSSTGIALVPQFQLVY